MTLDCASKDRRSAIALGQLVVDQDDVIDIAIQQRLVRRNIGRFVAFRGGDQVAGHAPDTLALDLTVIEHVHPQAFVVIFGQKIQPFPLNAHQVILQKQIPIPIRQR